jgi:hypothetical protein
MSENPFDQQSLIQMFQGKEAPFIVGLASLQPVGIDSNIADLLTDHMANTLEGVPNVSLRQIHTSPPERDEDILVWAAKKQEALGVSYVIVGSVGLLGSKYIVSLRRIVPSAHPEIKARFDVSAYQLEDSMDALLESSAEIWSKIAQEERKGLPREDVKSIVFQNRGDFVKCYDQFPELGNGKVVLSYIIRGSGLLAGLSVHKSDFSNEEFHKCLIAQNTNMLFPSSASEITIIKFPIAFTR